MINAVTSDPRVDPRYLPSFLAVCQCGSVRAAASVVHRTQPALSYQIRRLEEQLGAPLFERTGRRLVLTASGEALRDFTERSLGELAGLAERISRRAPERARALRVASVSGFGRYVLFPALCRVLASPAHAAVRIDLAFLTAAEVYARVEGAAADLGVVYTARATSRVRLQPFYREELVLIAPLRRVARFAEPRSWSRLETYTSLPFVTYEEGDHVFGLWFRAVFGHPPQHVAGGHNVQELEEVVELVAAGFGVSILPVDSARHADAARRVRIIRPAGVACRNDVYGVTRPGPPAHPELDALVAALRAEL